MNKMMKETIQKMNIHLVTTSILHPQSNSTVERRHQTINDILSKLINNKWLTRGVYISPNLTGMVFRYNYSNEQSPFSLLYDQDAFLTIDNVY